MSAIPVDAYGDDYGGRFGLLTSSIVIVAVIVNRTPGVVSIAFNQRPTELRANFYGLFLTWTLGVGRWLLGVACTRVRLGGSLPARGLSPEP